MISKFGVITLILLILIIISLIYAIRAGIKKREVIIEVKSEKPKNIYTLGVGNAKKQM